MPKEINGLPQTTTAANSDRLIIQDGTSGIAKHIEVGDFIVEITSGITNSSADLDAHRFAGHLDHPSDSVSDTHIGWRRISDNSAPNSDEGPIKSLFGYLANRITAITGENDWKDNPSITLLDLSAHSAQTDNPHSVTAAQIGAAESFHTHQIEIITTLENNTNLILSPDGSGGVTWVAPAGVGDMLQSVYDVNADGIVDAAAVVNDGVYSKTAQEISDHLDNNSGNPHQINASLIGALAAVNNLSELTDLATARTNLGLGTASLNNTQDFQPNNAFLSQFVGLAASSGILTNASGTLTFGQFDDLTTTEIDTSLRLAPDGLGGIEWADTDIAELTTTETDTSLRLSPDGTGGTVWVADTVAVTNIENLGTTFTDTSLVFAPDGVNGVTAIALPSSDMTRAVYDTNNNGIVDGAESLNDGANTITALEGRNHIDATSNPHGVTATQTGSLAIANNLSDLGDLSTARDNLGIVSSTATTITASTYTLTNSDKGNFLHFQNACTITFPDGLDNDLEVEIINDSTGRLTLEATTELRYSDITRVPQVGSAFFDYQYQRTIVRHLSGNTWYAFGDLKSTATALNPLAFLVYFDAETGVTQDTSGGINTVSDVSNQGTQATTLSQTVKTDQYAYEATGAGVASLPYFRGIEGGNHFNISDTGLGGLSEVAFYCVCRITGAVRSSFLDFAGTGFTFDTSNNSKLSLEWDGVAYPSLDTNVWLLDEWFVYSIIISNGSGNLYHNDTAYPISGWTGSLPTAPLAATTISSSNISRTHDIAFMGWSGSITNPDPATIIQSLRSKYGI